MASADHLHIRAPERAPFDQADRGQIDYVAYALVITPGYT